jgi:glycosyltransferase involved in cell wall biosynthesis
MRVLYLNPSGQLGGAEVCLLNMMASVGAARPEWQLHLIASDDGALVLRAAELGINATVLPFHARLARLGDAGAGGPAGDEVSRFTLLRRLLAALPSALSYKRRLRRAILKLSPDVIHTNGFKMHVLGALARPQGTPVVWHIHDYVQSRPVMARLLKLLAKRCAIAITNSKSVAEDVRKVCGELLPVRTLYNGIDLNIFSPDGPELDLDELSGLPPAAPGTVRVGLLATLARWKGHATFLRAMALVPESLPVRGYITTGQLYQTDGSQSSQTEIKKLIETLSLSRRIGLTGFVDRPASAMRALDVVVHASTEPEPFGLVIAEGMACGKAVITSHSGGATELVEEKINALTHQPGDAKALARAIVELTTDAHLRARLGAAGRLTAEQRFDRTRLATELIPIYQEVSRA